MDFISWIGAPAGGRGYRRSGYRPQRGGSPSRPRRETCFGGIRELRYVSVKPSNTRMHAASPHLLIRLGETASQPKIVEYFVVTAPFVTFDQDMSIWLT
jgi:hypothetical protein